LLWDGEWIDAELMAMLDDDWSEHGGSPATAPRLAS
jgi:hypothetical protein